MKRKNFRRMGVGVFALACSMLMGLHGTTAFAAETDGRVQPDGTVSVTVPTEMNAALMADGTVVTPSGMSIRNNESVPVLMEAYTDNDYGHAVDYTLTVGGTKVLSRSNRSDTTSGTPLEFSATESKEMRVAVPKLTRAKHAALIDAATAAGGASAFRVGFRFYPKEKPAFAVYSAQDQSLRFYKRYGVPTAGSQFDGKVATKVYQGVEHTSPGTAPWSDVKASVKSVSAVDGIRPAVMANWFRDFSSCLSFDLKNFDTSDVTDMSSLFQGCSSVVDLDVSMLNTSKVTRMSYMFADCSRASYLRLGSIDTSQVLYMDNFMKGANNQNYVDLSKQDLGRVRDISGMLSGVTNPRIIRTPKRIGDPTAANVTSKTFYDSNDGFRKYAAGSFPKNLTTSHILESNPNLYGNVNVSVTNEGMVLSASVSGFPSDASPRYQWYTTEHGSPSEIPGATQSTYRVHNYAKAAYFCRVTDANGVFQSSIESRRVERLAGDMPVRFDSSTMWVSPSGTQSSSLSTRWVKVSESTLTGPSNTLTPGPNDTLSWEVRPSHSATVEVSYGWPMSGSRLSISVVDVSTGSTLFSDYITEFGDGGRSYLIPDAGTYRVMATFSSNWGSSDRLYVSMSGKLHSPQQTFSGSSVSLSQLTGGSGYRAQAYDASGTYYGNLFSDTKYKMEGSVSVTTSGSDGLSAKVTGLPYGTPLNYRWWKEESKTNYLGNGSLSQNEVFEQSFHTTKGGTFYFGLYTGAHMGVYVELTGNGVNKSWLVYDSNMVSFTFPSDGTYHVRLQGDPAMATQYMAYVDYSEWREVANGSSSSISGHGSGGYRLEVTDSSGEYFGSLTWNGSRARAQGDSTPEGPLAGPVEHPHGDEPSLPEIPLVPKPSVTPSDTIGSETPEGSTPVAPVPAPDDGSVDGPVIKPEEEVDADAQVEQDDAAVDGGVDAVGDAVDDDAGGGSLVGDDGRDDTEVR